MSSSVLFDSPGPKTRVRHRLYTVIAVAVVVAAAVWLVMFLDDKGQLTDAKWHVFTLTDYLNVIWHALLDTLSMAGAAIVLAVIFGVVFGVGKLSDHAFVRWPSFLVVEFFRATPVLILMLLMFFQWGIGGGFWGHGPYVSVVLALMLYNGAVLAEVFRAGVLSLPKGQSEAAYAIGMRKTQVMTIVLLPQAVKVMLPALISQCVVALKDTSLGMYIVAPGLTYIGRQIYIEQRNQLQTALVISALYIICNLILTVIATWMQRRLVGTKKPLEVGMTALAGANPTSAK